MMTDWKTPPAPIESSAGRSPAASAPSTASSARPCAGSRPRSGAWPRAPRDPVPGGEDAGLPALPRAPQAAPLRGHRPREVRGLLALRRGLPGQVHPGRGGREHAREPGLRGRALRGGLRDQHVALHLLRLLRGGLPVRRDHDGQRLRAVRLRPLGSDLHQGDAARRSRRAHAAAARGNRTPAPCGSSRSSSSSPASGSAGALGVVVLRNPFYSVLALVVAPARPGGALPAPAAPSSSPRRRWSSTPAR